MFLQKKIVTKILLLVMPPMVVGLGRKIFELLAGIFVHNSFEKWWSVFKQENSGTIPVELDEMISYRIRNEISYRRVSQYWDYLNRKNITQLAEHDFANFKQTVARNYFTWLGGLNTPDYSSRLFEEGQNLKFQVDFREVLKRHSLLTLDESVFYNLETILMYRQTGSSMLAQYLDEPLFGNPPFINLDNHRISQDSLNSLYEFSLINSAIDVRDDDIIIEVGGGYGRTAHYFLSHLNVRYFVVDIPPALYIAQTYLKKVHPEKNIFSFCPFQTYQEVKQDIESADVVFLMPEQLSLLPEGLARIFLAIDCLHEMTEESVKEIFDESERLSKYLYFKCWNQTTVPFDKIKWSRGDYPVKENWMPIVKQTCRIPASFFEELYEIRKDS